MKKSIFTLLAVLFLTLTANAQRDASYDRLQLKRVSQGTEVDSLLALDSKGHVKYIPQSQLAPPVTIPTLQQVTAEGNSTTSDLIFRKVGSTSEQKITFDTDNHDIVIGQNTVGGRTPQTEFYINKNGTNILSFDNYNTFRFERNGSVLTPLEIRSQFTPYTIRLSAPSGLTQNVFQTFQNKSGVVATTEDFDDWLRDSGTSVGGDLKVEIGDYFENNNGTTLEVDDSNSRFFFKDGTITSSNNPRFIAVQLGNILSDGSPSGFHAKIKQPTAGFTANRDIEFQDGDGKVAFLKDIPIKANFYDEGTFTPILDDTSSSTPFTYDVEKAIYKRVGNTVFYELRLTNINGTASGAARLKNLPATVESQSITYSNVGRLLGSNINNVEKVSAQVDFTQGGGISLIAKDTDVFNSNITFTNGVLYISGSYPTNIYTP